MVDVIAFVLGGWVVLFMGYCLTAVVYAGIRDRELKAVVFGLLGLVIYISPMFMMLC